MCSISAPHNFMKASSTNLSISTEPTSFKQRYVLLWVEGTWNYYSHVGPGLVMIEGAIMNIVCC